MCRYIDLHLTGCCQLNVAIIALNIHEVKHNMYLYNIPLGKLMSDTRIGYK